jgi:copper chaperone CopZ
MTAMEIIRFKTNIHTKNELEKISTVLNNVVGLNKWELDLQDADNVLTICAGEFLPEEKIIEQIHEAGYYATNIDDYYSVY